MAVPTSTDQVHRTPLEEANKSFDRGSATFVDVRDEGEYREAHIPGALHIPASGPQEEYFQLPRNSDVILYCASPAEAYSAQAALTLLQAGYTRVSVIQGGFNEWRTAGYPVEGSGEMAQAA